MAPMKLVFVLMGVAFTFLVSCYKLWQDEERLGWGLGWVSGQFVGLASAVLAARLASKIPLTLAPFVAFIVSQIVSRTVTSYLIDLRHVREWDDFLRRLQKNRPENRSE